jgi:hypothetical protein
MSWENLNTMGHSVTESLKVRQIHQWYSVILYMKYINTDESTYSTPVTMARKSSRKPKKKRKESPDEINYRINNPDHSKSGNSSLLTVPYNIHKADCLLRTPYSVPYAS